MSTMFFSFIFDKKIVSLILLAKVCNSVGRQFLGGLFKTGQLTKQSTKQGEMLSVRWFFFS